MSTYLQKRRRRWYAVLEIPALLRPRIGKPRFVKSLETDSLAAAQRRVGPVVAGWLTELERARAAPAATDGWASDAAFFRKALRNATSQEDRDNILEAIEGKAWEIGAVNVENIGDPPSSDPEAQEFYAQAVGSRVETLEHLDEWLASTRTSPKTKDMQRTDIQRFAARFPMLSDARRPEVRRWVAELMNDGGLSPKTVQRSVSGLRGYWRFLQGISVVKEADEPFSKLEVARQAKRREPQAARQPFEPADVPKLLAGATKRDDAELADLIRLGMWTGCRIEELCALKVADVAGDRFTVREAKSAAGVRVVPIHSELQETVARLTRDSRDGYVLSGLSFNKYGDRSNAIGKRFGRLRTDLRFGPQFVFHSLRKTVVTILENAGASENVVADIVGHEKPRITYGLYSGGATLEVKRATLEKLAYPS